MSSVFLLKGNDKMEPIQQNQIQVVVKNVNDKEIMLQSAERICLKEEEEKTTEYFLQVEDQDENVEIHQAEFVAIENECPDSEDADSQFESLEMDDNDQIILQDKDVILWNELCRICANSSDKVVPIFSGEGLEHELSKKIQTYLPLNVSENDSLPLQVCYNCAATLLAWHDMMENCLDAQQRLTELQNKLSSKTQVQNNVSECEEEELNDHDIDIEDTNNQEDQMQVEAEEESTLETVQIVDESEIDRAEPQQQQKQQKQQKDDFSYVCGVCEKLYKKETELVSHMLAEHPDEANNLNLRYECNICSRTYTTKSKLVAHMRTHEDDQHKENVLQDEKASIDRAKFFCSETCRLLFKCQFEDCGAVLKSRRAFLRHMRVHKDERPMICEHCGKSYRIEDDLKRHIDDVHLKIKRHPCDICDRYFAAKGTRDAHRRIHTQEKPFPCPECGKHFRSINLLGVHRRIHRDLRPFKCSYCPMAFRDKQKRVHHEAAIHTNNKPHECDQCNRKFAAKGELTRHRSVHFPERPFVCSDCGIGFRLSRYLRTHIKRYHAEVADQMIKNMQRV